MVDNQHIWQKWIDTLHKWGIDEAVATLLEATGPLNAISAQTVYLGQPFLNVFLPENYVDAFADLLDNPMRTRAFIEMLRKQHLAG